MSIFRKMVKLPLVLLAMAVVLTGCIRVNLDITIKKDGKADISMVYAVQDSMKEWMDEGDSLLDPEDAEQYRKEGWEVADYSADGFTGYVLSGKDMDLNSTELLEGSQGTFRKEGPLYILDLEVFGEEDAEGFSESASMIKSMGGSFTVRITLPRKPEKHNATSETNDGKTLEWDLLAMDPAQGIHVEFRLADYTALISVLIAVAIAAAGAVFIVMRKKDQEARALAVDEPEYESAAEAEEVPAAPADEEPVSAAVPDEEVPAEEPAAEEVSASAAEEEALAEEVSAPVAEEESVAEEAPAPAAEAQDESLSPKKICRNCGKELTDESIFCPICGTRYEE